MQIVIGYSFEQYAQREWPRSKRNKNEFAIMKRKLDFAILLDANLSSK